MSAAVKLQTNLEYALSYAAIGWHVFPVHYITQQGSCSCGNPDCNSPGKHPATLHGFKNATNDPDKIRQLFKDERLNIAVATGAVSGFFVLDVDPRNGGDDTLAMLTRQHGDLPDTVVAMTGGGGQHYLFMDLGFRLPASIGPGIDLKGDGGYIVVEPSNHASGGAYQWEGEYDPLDGVAVAYAPEWLQSRIKTREQPAPAPSGSYMLSHSQVLDLRSALSFIPADDYDWWFKVGSALHSSDASNARGLWLEWSQTSEKYDPAGATKQWARFRQDGNGQERYNLESIFFWAAQFGWVNTTLGRINPAITTPAPVAKQNTTPTELNIDPIPGVLGQVADWINATSRKPQPLFALQAALAFGSTVIGRKYVTTNRNWSSLYFLNIGKSASGKEHAKWAIEKLLQAADLDDLIGPGRYSSESGVLSALIQQPCHCAIVDEFGKMLDSSNASGNFMARDSVKSLIEVWGRCDGIMRPVAYSTAGLSERVVEELRARYVVNPGLSMLAMTTPESFFDAVCSKGVRDGFLNRFLIGHSTIGRQPSRILGSVPDVPGNISDWARMARQTGSEGDLAQCKTTHDVPPDAITIPFSKAANELFRQFEVWCLEQMDALEDDGLAEMHGRSNEMAMRLSLIVAISCESRTIQDDHAAWAIDYVRQLQEINIDQMRNNLADSPFAKLKNDVYSAILKAGEKGMTHRDINRAVHAYKGAEPRTQDMIMDALQRDLIVQWQEVAGQGGRGRKRNAWVAVDPDNCVENDSTIISPE